MSSFLINPSKFNELADIIISNDGSLQELEEKVKKIHHDLEKEIFK